MHMKNVSLKATAILFFVSQLCFADKLVEDELIGLYGSEEFISIATGHKQLVSQAPAVASVIDADEIKRMGATDVDQVLEAVPGLHVSYNHQGYYPIYTIRGVHSSFNPQVLFLINGVPQTNLFTGSRNFVWAGMPVEAIQRVEVIRGPGSAIYGADAFAGVINIITKSGDSNYKKEMGARYGSFETIDFFASYQNQSDEYSLALNIQGHKTDGHDEIIVSDAQTNLDLITGTSASLAPGPINLGRESIDINFDFRLENFSLNALYQGRYDAQVGAGIAQALDPFSEYRSDRLMLNTEYVNEHLANDLSVRISGSYLDVSQEVEDISILFPPGSTGPFLSPQGNPLFGVFEEGVIASPEVFERHSRLNITFHYVGADNHDISVGVGYYHGDLHKVKEEKNFCTDPESCAFILPAGGVVDVSDTPFVFLEEGDRENHYIYLQDVFSLANDWELTAGVRYDEYSDFGNTVNPRFALVWSTTRDLTTKFLYGEAFRAPAFAETRAINNPSALGNPDLGPETLKSYEVVFDYRVNYDLNLILNTFYYEWSDIIQFVPDASGSVARAQNAGEQEGYGLEAEANWRLNNNLDLTANFAWQNSTNETTDSDAANAPGRQLYLQAHWQFTADTSLNVRANWVMAREREVLDPRDEVDDFILFDLTLRHRNFLPNLEGALLVRNLFDEDAREPTPNGFPAPSLPGDLPLPGRTFMGELRYNF